MTRPKSIHSTWTYDNESRHFELVEVLLDGEPVDLDRVIRSSSDVFTFSVLEAAEAGQIGLFEEDDKETK